MFLLFIIQTMKFKIRAYFPVSVHVLAVENHCLRELATNLQNVSQLGKQPQTVQAPVHRDPRLR